MTFKAGDTVRALQRDPDGYFKAGARFTIECTWDDGLLYLKPIDGDPKIRTRYVRKPRIFELDTAAPTITVVGDTTHSTQIGGTHYTRHEIQPWDALKCWLTGMEPYPAYMTGNAVKYLARWHNKGGVEDLKKARHYVDALIAHVEAQHSAISPPQPAQAQSEAEPHAPT